MQIVEVDVIHTLRNKQVAGNKEPGVCELYSSNMEHRTYQLIQSVKPHVVVHQTKAGWPPQVSSRAAALTKYLRLCSTASLQQVVVQHHEHKRQLWLQARQHHDKVQRQGRQDMPKDRRQSTCAATHCSQARQALPRTGSGGGTRR